MHNMEEGLEDRLHRWGRLRSRVWHHCLASDYRNIEPWH
jgi:hypothetical protein